MLQWFPLHGSLEFCILAAYVYPYDVPVHMRYGYVSLLMRSAVS